MTRKVKDKNYVTRISYNRYSAPVLTGTETRKCGDEACE
jgi:hypothetical protein